MMTTLKPENQITSREDVGRYRPLTQAKTALFLTDWEGFVLACIRRMRVPDEEDVLYRVFHRALLGLRAFRQECKLSTWLYRITWRESIRTLNRLNKIQTREAPFDELTPSTGDGEDGEDILAQRETQDRVRAALAKLNPMDREILALRYLDELKIGEVAERLEIPVGTVKARTHRALKRLKRTLERTHDTKKTG